MRDQASQKRFADARVASTSVRSTSASPKYFSQGLRSRNCTHSQASSTLVLRSSRAASTMPTSTVSANCHRPSSR